MPNAKKQKNGKWRCQLSVIEMIDGKKVEKNRSFTGSTKAEAEYKALQYKESKSVRIDDVSVQNALRRYIDSKSHILSPSTLRGYTRDSSHILAPLHGVSLSRLDTETVQRWINNAATTYSPKSIKNAHGLLVSSVTAISPDWSVRVTMPKSQKKEYYIPTLEQVRLLIDEATTDNLRKSIKLAAYGSLRRGEICALTPEDIGKDYVKITKDMILTPEKKYIVKPMPKTLESNRTVPLPPDVIEDLRAGLVDCTPHAITVAFDRLVKKLKLPHMRFHDLRHFFASYCHLKGIPDAYIEKIGGWRPGSEVMKAIYRNTINEEEKRQAERIRAIFSQKKKRRRVCVSSSFSVKPSAKPSARPNGASKIK